jgi:hypothetical protein
MKSLSERKAALELSIGTIVIVVIGMSMLILGLVLVRTIFTGSTDSIDLINDRVKEQISGLFSDDGTDVVVKLGEGQTAKIKPDDSIKVAIGARTPDGSNVGSRNRLQYKLTIESPSGSNCASLLGGIARVERLFTTQLNTFNAFDQFDGSTAFALVEIRVPKGTVTCSQKVFVDVRDTEGGGDIFGGNFFIVEILKEGFF